MEKPRVLEIKVRIDCNGCVQKIKKALHEISGIKDIYIDVAQQKLTIIGCVDPEKLVKAIKKTRKLASIVSETQPSSNPETVVPTDPPKEPESLEPEPEPEPEPKPSPPAPEPLSTHSTRPKSPQMSRSEEAEEVHVVHHYPSDHNHIHEQASSMEHYSSPTYKHEPQSVQVKHNFNTPQHYTHYNRSEPPPQRTYFTRPEPPPQQTHFTRPDPPQTHFTKPKPPQTHFTGPKPLQAPQHYTHYNRPKPPPQQTHYTKPPKHNSHYHGPEPPLQRTQNNKPEPPQPNTIYGRAEPGPQYYTNYNGENHSSSNGDGNVMSIFSDDNPNACTIV